MVSKEYGWTTIGNAENPSLVKKGWKKTNTFLNSMFDKERPVWVLMKKNFNES